MQDPSDQSIYLVDGRYASCCMSNQHNIMASQTTLSPGTYVTDPSDWCVTPMNPLTAP
jgi:hypothetical protein